MKFLKYPICMNFNFGVKVHAFILKILLVLFYTDYLKSLLNRTYTNGPFHLEDQLTVYRIYYELSIGF